MSQSFKFLSVLFVSVLCLSNAALIHAQTLIALITTNKGDITVELNQQAAPTSVANFVNLSLRGFYDGLTFHRVENRFMIQGGDPEGDGTGSPGYRFAGETNLRHNRPGVVSTANAGPGTDGSQFFITHIATPHLDGIHSVFGVVTSGMQVVNQIRRGDKIQRIVITGDIAELWTRKAEDLARWNAALDENFSNLKPAPSP